MNSTISNQRRILLSEKTKEKGFWAEKFKGSYPSSTLIKDYYKEGFKEAIYRYEFSKEINDQLNKLSNGSLYSQHMLLISCLRLLQYRYQGNTTGIVWSLPYKQTNSKEVSLINPFVPIINTLTPSNKLEDQLKLLVADCQSSYEHSNFPVDLYLEDRYGSENLEQRVEILLGMKNIHDLSIVEQGTIPLALVFEQSEEQLFLEIQYDSNSYMELTISRFVSHFERILEQLPHSLKSPLEEIEIIGEQERKALLEDFNPGSVNFNNPSLVHEWFEQQAKLHPGKIAVSYKDEMYSYGFINEKSNQLGWHLRSRGVGRDVVVGLMTGRKPSMVIGILGILKAGGAFCPIDPEYAASRILTMLGTGEINYLLTDNEILRSIDITSILELKERKYDIQCNPPQSQILDFNSIPIPDRSLIEYKRYHKFLGVTPVKHTITIQATRGCPYHCLYCHKIWPKKHVRRCWENILTEIDYNYQAGARRFVFLDDIFNFDKENCRRMLEEIINRNYDLQLFFPNGLRTDILSKEIIDLMVEAGTVEIIVALETGSPRIQKLVKKNLRLEKFIENTRYIAEKYPQVILGMEMMHGFPTETEEEAYMTLDLLKSIKWVHFPHLHILKIFPNTEMYHLARESGISEESIERSTHLVYHELPETLPFPKSFTRKFQNRFMVDYVLNQDRLKDVLPYQMQVMTEDELIQRYNGYLPTKINSFQDILNYTGLTQEDMRGYTPLKEERFSAPNFDEKITDYFKPHISDSGAFRIMLLDLSQPFSQDLEGVLYDPVEAPLGLLYLQTYLNKRFGSKIKGKVMKSRIDFDGPEELRKYIEEFKPDLIGIRTLSCYKGFFHRTVLQIRQWGIDIPVIAGGPYATTDYKYLLQDMNVTLAVAGEGEHVLGEIVERMISNGNKLPSFDELTEVKGIAFNLRDEIKSKRQRELILLDQVGLADYPKDNLPRINESSDLVYMIHTSGSTGKPKGVMLEHRHISNLVSYHLVDSKIDFNKVLQFAALSFDVSIQEIFPTLLFGGCLELIDKDLRTEVKELFKLMDLRQIKSVFLPASFVKYVFKEDDFIESLPKKLEHIISAGEQLILTKGLRTYLKNNNITIHNHYGPSETHLCTVLTLPPSETLPELPSIGSPIANTRIYVLDSQENLLPMGAAGEIYIGGKQVGRGYYGNDMMTEERYKEDKFKGGVMYKSGDLGRWLPNGTLEFLGRIDHQVKIRGHRVEPGEIEHKLLSYPGVNQAVVIAKEDVHGQNDLYAYYEAEEELDENQLKSYLGRFLPEYMFPSYYQRLSRMPLSPSGKVVREKLPSIDVTSAKEYSPAENQIQEVLLDIWADILDIDRESISIDADFFMLGGQSLRATVITNRVQQEFSVKIPLAKMFKAPTIRQISLFIEEAKTKKLEHALPRAEKREYYEMSMGQQGLYIEQVLQPESKSYNMPFIIHLADQPQIDIIEKVMCQLIKRHSSLRTSFHLINDKSAQKIHDEVTFQIEEKEVETIDIQTIVEQLVKPFNLEQAPLLRSTVVRMVNGKYFLLIDFHHIITDGTSHTILEREFKALYNGEKLPDLTYGYVDYSQLQNSKGYKNRIEEQEKYWQRKLMGETHRVELPYDFEKPMYVSSKGRKVYLKFQKDEVEKIRKIIEEEKVTLYSFIFTSFSVLLAKISGQDEFTIGMPIEGRNHQKLEEIVGKFVNILPVKTEIERGNSFKQLLKNSSNNIIEAQNNQDYDIDLNKKNSSDKPEFFNNINVICNGIVQFKDKLPDELDVFSEREEHVISNSHYDLSVISYEIQDEVVLEIIYRSELFEKETLNSYINDLQTIISKVMENIDIPINEIEIESEMKRIHTDTNDFKFNF